MTPLRNARGCLCIWTERNERRMSNNSRIEVTDGVCLTEMQAWTKLHSSTSQRQRHLHEHSAHSLPVLGRRCREVHRHRCGSDCKARPSGPLRHSRRVTNSSAAVVSGGCGFDCLHYEHRAEIGYWCGSPTTFAPGDFRCHLPNRIPSRSDLPPATSDLRDRERGLRRIGGRRRS